MTGVHLNKNGRQPRKVYSALRCWRRALGGAGEGTPPPAPASVSCLCSQAFAAQAAYCVRKLGIPESKLNPLGQTPCKRDLPRHAALHPTPPRACLSMPLPLL